MGFWTFVTIMVLVGLAKSVMKHRQQMAEVGHMRREDGELGQLRVQLKLGAQQKGDARLLAEIEQLRKEFASLRDTATQYDLSFDTALQGIASRVARLEQRVDRAEVGAAPRIEVG
ncbi:MAG: hypothetical protein IT208_01830 [Chthonomonadales bacterium]|nr:hypothetical protein [Chthonomonadales bacterium]